uniref:Uncharacterized protein n=1 Tax=Caenorhabditis tropicalis TaxID=1561998 RepID=A0A1I7T3A0_9PELO
MSADTMIVDSFIRVTNYFASKYGNETGEIGSLVDLWKIHGNMISQMMDCDTKDFRSSDLFYEVLHRKFVLINGSLAEDLNPAEAANGDLLEICKFFVLFLEYLRKDHPDMLSNVLENLNSLQTGFKSVYVLDLFAFFDKLYSEDNVEDWWTCLVHPTDDSESSSGFRTPTRNNSFLSYTTPTATARRLRTATSTARRSPIVEAVDSPTMKFMRSERELKQAKIHLRDAQNHVEDLEKENEQLKKENRKQKITIDDLKADMTGKRATAEEAEKQVQEMCAQLKKLALENEGLQRQLNEYRDTVRTQKRQLEDLEIEKEDNSKKLSKATEDLEDRMRELRRTRDTTEEEIDRYRRSEIELNEKLRVALQEASNLTEHLATVESLKSNLHAENMRLTSALDEVNIVVARSQQDADNTKTLLNEEKELHQKQMEKMQLEKTERTRMAEETIKRLGEELEAERKERRELNQILADLQSNILVNDRSSHDQNEQAVSARVLLESTRQRVNLMQVELDGKNKIIAVQKDQIENAKGILQSEQVIREKCQISFDRRIKEIELAMNGKQAEVDSLKEKMANLSATHQNEIAAQTEEFKLQTEELQRVNEELKKLQEKLAETTKMNVFFEERIKLFEKSDCSRPSSVDSLPEYLESQEAQEDMNMINALTSRKSVAYSVDMNGEDSVRCTPIGFKNEPRESISSLESFGRNSNTRYSMRSDTLTIASNGEFKQPFTPTGPSKERVGVLTARNQRVRPHLQSAYSVELGNSDSPSADEKVVRQGGTPMDTENKQQPKKKRRESFFMRLVNK